MYTVSKHTASNMVIHIIKQEWGCRNKFMYYSIYNIYILQTPEIEMYAITFWWFVLSVRVQFNECVYNITL